MNAALVPMLVDPAGALLGLGLEQERAFDDDRLAGAQA